MQPDNQSANNNYVAHSGGSRGCQDNNDKWVWFAKSGCGKAKEPPPPPPPVLDPTLNSIPSPLNEFTSVGFTVLGQSLQL